MTRSSAKRLPVILIFILFAVGVGMISYPYLSDYLYEKNASKIVQDYNEQAALLSQEQIDEEWQRCVVYNDSLLESYTVITEPFDPDTFPVTKGTYAELLAANDCMAVVRIPSIGVNLPVYHGTDEATLSKGAGHLQNTSLPVGGVGSHSVISAHTGLMEAEFFTDLDKLVEGNLAYIDVLGKTLVYKVTSIEVVEPSDTSSLYPVAGRDMLTLVTCTPYGVNSHRLLVHCDRVPDSEIASNEAADEVTAVSTQTWELALFAVAAVLALLFVGLLVAIFVLGVKRRPAPPEVRGKHVRR